VAKGKRIYGEGINVQRGLRNCHAETEAIADASCWDWSVYFQQPLKGMTLYTLMVRKDGTLGEASPCPECMKAIKAAGIRKVVVYL
jgi:tRNA(Arg) A34 adenosine deaminase TadA